MFKNRKRIKELEAAIKEIRSSYEKIVDSYKSRIENYEKLVELSKNQNKIDKEVIISQETEIESLKAKIAGLKETVELYREQYGETIEISEFNAAEVGGKCAHGAWYGGKSKAELVIDSAKIVFEGTVYDSSYENYTADCDVTLVDADGKSIPIRRVGSNCTGPYHVESYEKGTWEEVSEKISSLGEKGTLKFL